LNPGILYEGHGYLVSAVKVNHDCPSWGFILEECPRPGKFHPEKAKAKNVPEGPLWRKLQHGETIILGDGTLVHSTEVVDPQRKGIKVAYSGDTMPSKSFTTAAMKADFLIHEATYDESLVEKAIETVTRPLLRQLKWLKKLKLLGLY